MNLDPTLEEKNEWRETGTPNKANDDLVRWWRMVDVGDIMSSPVICIDRQSTLPEALELMKRHHVRRLPVLDGRSMVGIVTLGDLRGALPSEVTTLNRTELGYLMDQVTVERAMRHPVISVQPDTKLADAARLMLEHRIGGLPVLSAANEVMGLVTESDIFRILIDMLDPEYRSIRARQTKQAPTQESAS
ncbi:CBS domain-containing protein [Anaerolineae bacterium CFX7]|nr:CBS domain-containing protein [Anaerolineae bacterium CFX7]